MQLIKNHKGSHFFSKIIRTLFIKANSTPNPNFLKFVPGVIVMESGTIDFPAIK